MAYTMEESRKAFEVVRQLLLAATDETLDVSVIVGDSDYSGIITDEQERIEFLAKRGGKEWMLSEELKYAGTFTFAGTCAGDGYLTVSTGNEQFTFAPTTGDDAATIAAQCVSTINSQSSTWTASATGDTVRVVPLVEGLNKNDFTSESTDSGVTITQRSPYKPPYDLQLGGTATLNGRHSIFPGTAFRAPAP